MALGPFIGWTFEFCGLCKLSFPRIFIAIPSLCVLRCEDQRVTPTLSLSSTYTEHWLLEGAIYPPLTHSRNSFATRRPRDGLDRQWLYFMRAIATFYRRLLTSLHHPGIGSLSRHNNYHDHHENNVSKDICYINSCININGPSPCLVWDNEEDMTTCLSKHLYHPPPKKRCTLSSKFCKWQRLQNLSTSILWAKQKTTEVHKYFLCHPQTFKKATDYIGRYVKKCLQ